MIVEIKKPKDDKKASKEEKQKEVKPFTKIVVRRLPPRLSKEEFVETVGPLADNDYFHFVSADASLEPHAFSRLQKASANEIDFHTQILSLYMKFCGQMDIAEQAWAIRIEGAYINFLDPEDVFSFRDKFDGYVFVDDRGNEYQAIVEFSPYQKIPKQSTKSKKDPKSGTIELDPDFLSFIESIEKPDASSIFNPEMYLEELETKEKEAKVKEMTPLLEFIRDKKAEKARMREERMDARRKRDDDRRKAREEERKRKKENAEKNFLEMMNEKTKTDAADEKPREDKTKGRESGRGGGSDKDRNRGERNGKDERLSEKEKDRQRRREEDRQRRREKQREKERERRKETKRNSDKEMSEEKKREDKPEKKESGQTEAQAEDKKTRSEGQRKDVGKHTEEDEAARIRRENRARRERIKNKERPAMEIYRPGMGKFSSQTLKAGESKGSRPNSPDEPETGDKQLEATKKNEKPKRNQRDQQQRNDNEAAGSRNERRDSGRRKDESGYKDEKYASKPEKTGPVIIDERKRRPTDKPGFKDDKPKGRDERGPKSRGKDEKSESGFRNRNRSEKSGNKDSISLEDRPPREVDSGKSIGASQKSKEAVAAPKAVENSAEVTCDDGKERRSGKSYLSKRRERQQEREERAAKEQDE